MALGFSAVMGTLGAGAAGAAKAGLFAKIGAGIVKGFSVIKGFLVGKSAIIASGVTTGAMILSGTSIEGRKKKIAFGNTREIKTGKHSFSIAPVNVSNIRNSEYKKDFNSSKKSKKRK